MHKTHLKSFVFEILFIRDYTSQLKAFGKLEHLENEIRFCQDI